MYGMSAVFAVVFASLSVSPDSANPVGIGEARIVSTVPRDGYVDVRQDRNANGEVQGIQRFEIRFDRSAVLTEDDIRVTGSDQDAPAIRSVIGKGLDWTVELSRPIPGGSSVVLALSDGRTILTAYSRPGDVNLDGLVDETDLGTLEQAIADGLEDAEHFDFDRDGMLGHEDLVRLRDVLYGTDGATAWAGTMFTDGIAPPQWICCCHLGCNLAMGSCQGPEVQVPCPCPPQCPPTVSTVLARF